MNKEEIKVGLSKERNGCYFSDKVWIPFNPSEIESLEDFYKDMAEKETDYNEQGFYRKMKEKFRNAWGEWNMQRNEEKNK